MKLSEHESNQYQQVDWIESKVVRALKGAGIQTSIVEWTDIDSDLASEVVAESTYAETVAALKLEGWAVLAEAGTYTVMSRLGTEVFVSECGTRIKIPEYTGEWSSFVMEAEIGGPGGVSVKTTEKGELGEILKLIGKLAAGFMLVKYIVTPKAKKTMKMIARNLSTARRRCKYITDDTDKGICKLKVKIIESEGELELLTVIYNEECSRNDSDKKKCAKLKRTYDKKSTKLRTRIKQLNKGIDELEKQQKKEELELKKLTK